MGMRCLQVAWERSTDDIIGMVMARGMGVMVNFRYLGRCAIDPLPSYVLRTRRQAA